MCQPEATPTGISVSTWTISRPGIDDGDCWSTVRVSLLVSASALLVVVVGSGDISSSFLVADLRTHQRSPFGACGHPSSYPRSPSAGQVCAVGRRGTRAV